MRTRTGRRRAVGATFLAMIVTVGLSAPGSAAQPASDAGVRVVSARVPLLGPGRDLAATRILSRSARVSAPTAVAPLANPWQLEATIPGAVIHDISFATPRVGFAAAELGQVWKTVDGGRTWTEILNLGFPYYWYGVDALTANDVVISGFDNANFTGMIRWSHDGGTTWSDDVLVTTDGWANRVRFQGTRDGIVNSIVSLNSPNEAQYTTDGGGTAADWTTVTPDPNGGWFGADFTFLPNLAAYLSGITECRSRDGGQAWTCGPSVDPVFDGAVKFVNRRDGWVAGGEISPNVEGWVHRTTDGGRTWSDRTLDGPWPIRHLEFVNANKGWAAGGNVFSGVGGMYFTDDGGQTWTLDADTGAEMSSCTHLNRGSAIGIQVWCAGTNAQFAGVVYTMSFGAGG